MEPTFGERLGRWLNFKGIRAASLARSLGVSRTAVHNWMTDAVAPGTDRLAPIASALGMTMVEFFGPLPETTPLASPPPTAPTEDQPVPHPTTGDITLTLKREDIEAALNRSGACPTCGQKTGEAA